MSGRKEDPVTVVERLRKVFVQALDLGPDVDLDTIEYRGHPRWDSVGHMALVVAIEDEFAVELDANQLIGIDTLGAAVRILRDVGVVR